MRAFDEKGDCVLGDGESERELLEWIFFFQYVIIVYFLECITVD